MARGFWNKNEDFFKNIDGQLHEGGALNVKKKNLRIVKGWKAQA